MNTTGVGKQKSTGKRFLESDYDRIRHSYSNFGNLLWSAYLCFADYNNTFEVNYLFSGQKSS